VNLDNLKISAKEAQAAAAAAASVSCLPEAAASSTSLSKHVVFQGFGPGQCIVTDYLAYPFSLGRLLL
jgi:hypothetical protein